MEYLKSLDGFRALAVLLVIFDHWTLVNDHGAYMPSFLHVVPGGIIGVTMFFALSGFLISGILLNAKKMLEESQISLSSAFKVFYIRRTLRIFPVYYLLLLILLLLYPALFSFDKNSVYWLFTYATNVYLYVRQDWISYLMPLWSLAVEEQFYLLWPCIVLLTPSKHIFKVIVAFLIIGVGSRVVCEFGGPDLKGGGFYIFLTPTCFDAFALGAMLAMFYKDGRVSEQFAKVFNILSSIALLVFIYMMIFLKFPTPQQNILYRLVISIMSVGIITYLINNKGSLVERGFNNRALTYIGKISYGVYLFHNFIPFFYQTYSKYLAQKGFLIPFTQYSLLPYTGGFLQYGLYFFILISASSLSWFLFEKPINNLKSRFNYK